MTRNEKRETAAVQTAFLIIGCLEAAWAPMVPFVKKEFSLDEQQLGMLLLCTGLGSILGLPFAGPTCKRFGAKQTIYTCGILLAISLAVVSSMVNLWLTAVMLVVFGFSTVGIDVSANVNGVTLEEDYQKPLMSGFHAGYSLGTLIGAAAMSMLLTFNFEIHWATLLILVFVLTAFFFGCKSLLGKDDLNTEKKAAEDDKKHQRFYIPPLVLLVGMMCFIFYASEASVMNWSAVFVNQERGIDIKYAGYVYTSFAIMMTCMRFIGNNTVRRFGAKRVVMVGALLVALGFITVATVPHIIGTVIGFGLVGFGAANIVPQLISHAGKIPGMAIQTTISIVNGLGFTGLLLGPGIIGHCAKEYGLPATFVGIGILCGCVMIGARFLKWENSKC